MSTPGTRPPRKPSVRAKSGSWTRFSWWTARLKARTRCVITSASRAPQPLPPGDLPEALVGTGDSARPEAGRNPAGNRDRDQWPGHVVRLPPGGGELLEGQHLGTSELGQHPPRLGGGHLYEAVRHLPGVHRLALPAAGNDHQRRPRRLPQEVIDE